MEKIPGKKSRKRTAAENLTVCMSIARNCLKVLNYYRRRIAVTQ